jgi:hypothetical protein
MRTLGEILKTRVPNAVGSSSCVPFAICCISEIGHLKAALLFWEYVLIK